jgi:hypothetical protein
MPSRPTAVTVRSNGVRESAVIQGDCVSSGRDAGSGCRAFDAPATRTGATTHLVRGAAVDDQSIMVPCAACYDDPYERSHALGPIFRAVWWHSVAGAAVRNEGGLYEQ